MTKIYYLIVRESESNMGHIGLNQGVSKTVFLNGGSGGETVCLPFVASRDCPDFLLCAPF